MKVNCSETDKPRFYRYEIHTRPSFRLEKETAKKNKPNFIKETLIVPVRAVREKVEIAIEHTEMTKHIVEDKYHELRDQSECKTLLYNVCN